MQPTHIDSPAWSITIITIIITSTTASSVPSLGDCRQFLIDYRLKRNVKQIQKKVKNFIKKRKRDGGQITADEGHSD
jgi:hypothetical protein